MRVPFQPLSRTLNTAPAGLPAFFLALLACLPLQAAEPSFDELLARAEAQAAAGHGLSPPGDNVSETALALYKLVPTATPAQLNALTALLDREDLIERKSLKTMSSGKALTAPVAVPGATVEQPAVVTNAKALQPADPSVAAGIAPAVSPRQADDRTAPPDAHAVDLFARGKAAEERGDISAARRFYAGAAQLKYAKAAHYLGRLYDPAYLDQTAIGGIDADVTLANHWYELAAALGDQEAVPIVHSITSR